MPRKPSLARLYLSPALHDIVLNSNPYHIALKSGLLLLLLLGFSFLPLLGKDTLRFAVLDAAAGTGRVGLGLPTRAAVLLGFGLPTRADVLVGFGLPLALVGCSRTGIRVELVPLLTGGEETAESNPPRFTLNLFLSTILPPLCFLVLVPPIALLLLAITLPLLPLPGPEEAMTGLLAPTPTVAVVVDVVGWRIRE